MAYTLGIDLDVDQVKLCLLHVEAPQRVPYVDWLIFKVPFHFGPDYYCEFGSALMETIAHFLFVKKLGPQQVNRIYFVAGNPYSPFHHFEEGLHYTANMFIQSLFDPERVGILRCDGKPMAPRELLQVKGENASAFVNTQFYGSAYIASRLYKNAVLFESGASTTHITPILKARIDHQGRGKLPKYLRYRLAHRQLLPVGGLFTPINQIMSTIPLADGDVLPTPRICRMVVIASLLKYIHPEIAREHDFPLLEEKDARILLARGVGLDVQSLTDRELIQIAQGVYEHLADTTTESFTAVLARQKRMADQMTLVSSGVLGKPLIHHGLRKNKALQQRVVHLADKLPHRLHEASSAYGAALYAMDRLLDTSIAPDRVEVMP